MKVTIIIEDDGQGDDVKVITKSTEAATKLSAVLLHKALENHCRILEREIIDKYEYLTINQYSVDEIEEKMARLSLDDLSINGKHFLDEIESN